MKELIELAKKADVETINPEQRARVLDRARRYMQFEPSSPQAADDGTRRRAARRVAHAEAGQPAPLAPGRRAASRRRLGGHVIARSATAH